ncbi:CARDB domain-containing protein [Halomicrococcus sp. SG-WS-1]|uniref:CARDB domain-containing protein n=1 Tax=Halomicrococcus sp. SG-WS-1 TaxID=3439057 RepID=UPI003F7AD560
MNVQQFGVFLAVLALVAAPVAGTTGASGQNGSASVDVASERTAQDTNQTNQTNATFEPVQFTDERVSLAGTELLVESGFLTLRNGTLTLFVKTGTLSAGPADARVTNLRLVLGNRISAAEASRVRQQLARGDAGTLDVPDGVRNVQFLYGFLAVESRDETIFRDADQQVTLGEPTRLSQGNATAGPEEPGFQVTNLSAPDTVSVGESFEVTAELTNPGDQSGVEQVFYAFGGVVVQRQTVELSPGESRTVTFQVRSGQIPGEPGAYTHSVRAFDSEQSAQIRLTDGGNNSTAGSVAGDVAA